MFRVKVLLVLFCFFLFFSTVRAETKTNEVRIYFFHSNSCSHCKDENKLLKKIEKKYDNVVVYRYEVHDDKSINILEHVKDVYHIDGNSVPITVIGEKIFVGYREEKSVISFVRAIEYYSRYTYRDKVMGNVEIASAYHNYELVPKYEDFVNSYSSYSLLGFSSDDMEPSTSSMLIGVLSQFNLLSLLSIFIVFLFLRYIGGDRAKLVLLGFYLCSMFLFKIGEVIHSDYFYLAIGIIFFIIFMVGLVIYFKSKRRNYLIMNIFIVVVMLVQCFYSRFYGNYLFMLKDIATLYLLDGIDKIFYYLSYFMSIFMLNLLFMMIIYLFLQKKLRR